jgi:hypothetical protein
VNEDCKKARDLAIRIARCPVLMQALTEPAFKTDCRAIIGTQYQHGPNLFQLPEPWSGHITQARVLFISSNPSIDDGSGYPRKDWHDDDIFRYFDERFGTSIFDGAYTDPQHKYGVQ